jgi:hypothetical protein
MEPGWRSRYGFWPWAGRLRGRSSSPGRVQEFSLLHRFWGPPNFLSNGYQGFFLGGKRPGREADHSPPASVPGE